MCATATSNGSAAGPASPCPPRQGKLATTGVAAKFQIKGDFEITASYEILKAEQPTEGYGVGGSIYVAIDPDAGDAISLARRIGLKGKTNFLSDRMTPIPGQGRLNHFTRPMAPKAPTGKLRIQRVGSAVRFLAAEADSAEFVPIVQDRKANRIETEFGPADIRHFQIDGDAGNSEAALDMRWLDLTVEAEELPGLIAAKQSIPGWMLKTPSTEKASPPLEPTSILMGTRPSLSPWQLLWASGFSCAGVPARRPRRNEFNLRWNPRPPCPSLAASAARSSGQRRPGPESRSKCPRCAAGVRIPQPDEIEAE